MPPRWAFLFPISKQLRLYQRGVSGHIGLTLEQTLGTNWYTAIHPEDRERVLPSGTTPHWARRPFRRSSGFCRAMMALSDARQQRHHA